jgi:membrane protease subunit HflC
MIRFRHVVLLVLLLLWARTACFSVDYAEFATITRFGEPVAKFDGATEAGLHFKLPWPVDRVLRIDRRLHSFDLPSTESLTKDPATGTVDKTLTVDAFVAWRIPDSAAADQFVRAAGSVDQVQRILAPRIGGRIAAVVSGMSLDELVSVKGIAEADARGEKLQQQLLGDDLKAKVLAEYGVEIVALRIRRLSFPEAVRNSIYERIRSERGRKVAEYENDGRKQAAEILTKAEQERRRVEADARAEKQRIESKADVTADQLRNEAHAKDPEFYAFLQKLKAMQTALSESRDVLLLSLNHEVFKLLREPPKAGKP